MSTPGGALQATRARSLAAARQDLGAWQGLASLAPMQSPEWLLTWWEEYSVPEDELCVLFLHGSGGALVGVAPMYLSGAGSCPTLRLLGASDACTHHLTWSSSPGWEHRVGIEVAQFLLDNRGDWERVFFEAVDADAVAIHATMAHLVEQGCLGHRRQVHSSWEIVLPEDWDAYLKVLSRSLRKRCRKLQRQFLDSGRIQLRTAEDEDSLREGFAVLLQLHAARWGKGEKPLGVFDNHKFRTFHERVSRALLARDQLRLAWLELDGKPIAAEYQFYDERAVYAYQAGIDLDYDDYSPGKLSMMTAIQFALAQGCKSFDLLRGDEPYKLNWRAIPSPCYDLRAWQPGIRGRAEWAGWGGYSWAVRRLKPILPQRLVVRVLECLRWLKTSVVSSRR